MFAQNYLKYLPRKPADQFSVGFLASRLPHCIRRARLEGGGGDPEPLLRRQAADFQWIFDFEISIKLSYL
jgi:hypothetical protein